MPDRIAPPELPTRRGLREDLARYFQERRKLVESEALTLLLEAPDPLRHARALADGTGTLGPFITRTMVEELLAADARPIARSQAIAGPVGGLPLAESTPPFQLIADGFSEAPPGRKPLEAYGALFASRFRTLSKILRGRSDLPHPIPIHDLAGHDGPAAVVGMIRSLRQTAEKRHLILEIEDESGAAEVMIPRDRPAAKQSWLTDEVVALGLEVPRERHRIPIVNEVHRPDVPNQRTGHRADRPRRVLFLSDLHLGSRSFLTESWAELIAFLREEGPAPEVAREIAHVVIAGDLVDGIGIYPNQERDLAIHDIFEQYVELGRRLKELPSRLNIVVIPGNHDAVCPAEPQPSLPAEIRTGLPENVRPLGNPTTCALDGVVIEAYHGRSFDDLIPAIPGASYARPTDVMKTMLAMRHLAPIYGGRTPLAPLPRDGLVIDPVPDILVTGHAHTYGADQYRGILLLNASTWQAETEYQKMRNITAVPARAAVVNLEDLSLTTLDFDRSRPVALPGAAA